MKYEMHLKWAETSEEYVQGAKVGGEPKEDLIRRLVQKTNNDIWVKKDMRTTQSNIR